MKNMKTHALSSVIPRLLGAGPVLAIAGVLIAGTASATEWITPTIPASYMSAGFSWADAAGMSPFVLPHDASPARQRTCLKVGYGAHMLYVGISAEESDLPAVRQASAQGRPERVREADSVSVYLRVGENIYEFSVASDGALDEVRWRDGRQDCSWTVGAQWVIDRPNEWRGLLSIPLAAVDLAPSPALDGTVDFAAVRREDSFQEVAGWPACDGGMQPPAQWGVLRGGRKGGAYVSNYGIPRLHPGPSKFGYRLRPLEVKCEGQILISDGALPHALPLSRQEWTQPGGDGWRVFHYVLPSGAPLKLQTILRVDGEVFHASAVLPVPLRLVTADIEKTLARVRKLAADSAHLPQAVGRGQLQAAVGLLDTRLENLLAAGHQTLSEPPSADRSSRLNELAKIAEQYRWRSHILAGRLKALQAGSVARGFAVGTTHSIIKLRRYETDLEYGQPVRLRAAGRERESAQIVIVPFDLTLHDVEVTWSVLTGPGSAILPAQNIQVDLVGYVKTTPPDYQVEYVGWWADPLVPIRPFDVPSHHTQPLWLTLYAPEDAAAGIYCGTVNINAGRAGRFVVPVELEVLDYELPLRGKLRTIFGFDWNRELVGWYRWDEPQFRPDQYKEIPQQWARQIWDMTLAYRIYAGGLYERLRFPRAEDLDFCLERGLNNYQIGLPESDTVAQIPRLKTICDDLRRRGLLDMCYVYAWDEGAESNPNIRQAMIKNWTILGEEIPDLARADVYGSPPPEVMDVLDIVMPLTPELEHRQRWDRWRAQGNIIGAYVCCGPHHPYANFFIDYPAIDQRVLFWQLYDYNATFFLYYASNI